MHERNSEGIQWRYKFKVIARNCPIRFYWMFRRHIKWRSYILFHNLVLSNSILILFTTYDTMVNVISLFSATHLHLIIRYSQFTLPCNSPILYFIIDSKFVLEFCQIKFLFWLIDWCRNYSFIICMEASEEEWVNSRNNNWCENCILCNYSSVSLIFGVNPLFLRGFHMIKRNII